MGRTQTHAAGGGLTQPPDAAEAAREAGLTYASDIEPGIRRAREGKGFVSDALMPPYSRAIDSGESIDC
jgi:DNA topoisomerase IB